MQAYTLGIFPMARSRADASVEWISPTIRGVVPLNAFRVPRRLRKTIRRKPFEVRFNSDFEQVIHACAAPRGDGDGTWINDEIIRVFCQLHILGHTHSVETWRDGRLVGGLYGMALGGAFFGESMFSIESDASKVALIYLVAALKLGKFTLLDTQFITDHLRQFGAIEIPATAYLRRLNTAVRRHASFYSDLSRSELESVVEALLTQSNTQTS
jgi:leucyl/phenylalanyl-tRNA--protein transferase